MSETPNHSEKNDEQEPGLSYAEAQLKPWEDAGFVIKPVPLSDEEWIALTEGLQTLVDEKNKGLF